MTQPSRTGQSAYAQNTQRVAQRMNLKEKREAAGISLNDAANLLRVNASTLWAWEKERPWSVPASTLLAMCKLYGCDVNEILGWPEDKSLATGC